MLVFKDFVLHIIILPDVFFIGTGFPLLMILKLDITGYPFFLQIQKILLAAVTAVSCYLFQYIPKCFLMFLKEFYGMNYQEAVLALLNEDVSQLCPRVNKPKEKVKKPFELPPANKDNRRVFAYLLKHRHLDRDVLTTFVKLGLVYEDQKYHNAVFVGMDKDGTPRHAHKRSTNSQGKSFRMTVEGSDFRYAFNWPGSSNQLMVFEAPIDMLSFISKFHDSAWARHSYVALCGTSSQPMLGMLERYPQIDTVHFALDNDQAGQLAMRRLAALAREKGLTVNALVPVLKDWNEDLCANFQQTMEEQQNEQVLS